MTIQNEHIFYPINYKNNTKKYLTLIVLMFSVLSMRAQPDPDMFNKEHLNLLTQQINESDTNNYVLHWRRAMLLSRMAGRFEQLEPTEKKTRHNYFISDIGLLIDNEITLEGFKEVTIAHYYFTRANYYFSNNEQDKAIEDYKIAIEKDDKKHLTKQIYFKLLNFYETRKDYNNALIYCNKLIQQTTELIGNFCSCEDKSSLCSRKAELMYRVGQQKELLNYLKDLFNHSNTKDVYCYLNLYKHYYALVAPTELSKYAEEELKNTILETMEKLNNKVD